jgi:hypothetical protein
MNSVFRRASAVYSGLIVGLLSLGYLIVPSLLTPVTAAPVDQQATTPEQVAFFQKNIQPILTNHCYDCHSTQTRSAGGLRLDDRDALLAGGKSGSAILLGKPDESLILQRCVSTTRDCGAAGILREERPSHPGQQLLQLPLRRFQRSRRPARRRRHQHLCKGGNSGPAIIPGHPEKSLLIERVKSSDAKKRMPQESE